MIERNLQRLYERLETRYLWLYIGAFLLLAPLLCLVATAVFSLYFKMSTGQFLAIWSVAWAGLTVCTGVTSRSQASWIGPTHAWIRSGRPASTAPTAWKAAVSLPPKVIVTELLGAILITAAPVIALISLEFDVGLATALLYFMALLVAGIFPTGLLYFAFEAYLQPYVLDAASALPDRFEPAPGRIGVTPKLGLGLVAVNACAPVIVSIFTTATNHGSATDFARQVMLGLMFALTSSLLVTWLIVQSIRRPLEELTTAAAAVRQGGLDTRVAVSSANELGRLAASFNEMVQAISEREDLRSQATELELERAAHEAGREAAVASAIAAERTRIAREMHDVIAHSVSVMVLQAEVGERALDDGDLTDARRATGLLQATGATAMAELGRLLSTLREPETHDQQTTLPGLADLEQLVDSARRAGTNVTLHRDPGLGSSSPGLQVTAYRIVQEALTNALRHARAGRIDVAVRFCGDDVELEVCDDGRGLPADAEGSPGAPAGPTGGHGLIGMRERTALFGGHLEAGPRTSGTGFRVLARLPLGPGA